MERTATVRALLRSFFDSTEFTGRWRPSDLCGLRSLWAVSTPVTVGWLGVLGSSISDWSPVVLPLPFPLIPWSGGKR